MCIFLKVAGRRPRFSPDSILNSSVLSVSHLIKEKHNQIGALTSVTLTFATSHYLHAKAVLRRVNL